jgi:hypothetical protein
MKNAVFWDVAPCRSAATCSCWFLARGFFYPEDRGDIFLRNVGSHKIYFSLVKIISFSLPTFKN